MKCAIPEISWNHSNPVLSVDIQPINDEFVRLATAGSDFHVLIWYIVSKGEAVTVEIACDLNRHQKAVNAVRWSPDGEFLASGDDESSIILWKKRSDCDPQPLLDDIDHEIVNREVWLVYKILRGHMDDVYDLAWSPDCTQLISGSIDNSVIMWNVVKGTKQILNLDHKGFVQGVAWDPKNKYICTMCSDRNCRVFDTKSKKIVGRVFKSKLPVSSTSTLFGKVLRIYHDDTLKSFFRRPAFSPDGNLLVTPAGRVETEDCNNAQYFTYVYARSNFKQPVIAIPSLDCTLAVKFCPLLFELRREGPKSMIPLKYRMIFAIANQSSVVLYDTQQLHPFAVISNIHYTRLTDLSWSYDARYLVVSSTDGYCSIIYFDNGELGDVYNEPFDAEVDVLNKHHATAQAIETISSLSDDSLAARDMWTSSDNEMNENIKAEKLSDKCKNETTTCIEDSTDNIRLVLEEFSQDDLMV